MADLNKLKLAFSVHTVRDIVDADGVLDWEEMRLLGEMFPDATLRAAGFIDGKHEFTPAYDKAVDQATHLLSGALSIEQKLELVTGFRNACMADGEMAGAEMAVLRKAATTLGIPIDKLTAHLIGLSNS